MARWRGGVRVLAISRVASAAHSGIGEQQKRLAGKSNARAQLQPGNLHMLGGTSHRVDVRGAYVKVILFHCAQQLGLAGVEMGQHGRPACAEHERVVPGEDKPLRVVQPGASVGLAGCTLTAQCAGRLHHGAQDTSTAEVHRDVRGSKRVRTRRCSPRAHVR